MSVGYLLKINTFLTNHQNLTNEYRFSQQFETDVVSVLG
jgi:hypothetical protein